MSKQGFTLIEVVVAIFIFSLILAFLSGAFIFNVNQGQIIDKENELKENLIIALEQITHEVKEARKLEKGAVKKEGVTCLLDKENLFFINQKGSRTWYYLKTNGDLMKAVDNGKGYGHEPLAAGIKELHFTYNKAPFEKSDLITVQLEAETLNENLYSLESRVYLRCDYE